MVAEPVEVQDPGQPLFGVRDKHRIQGKIVVPLHQISKEIESVQTTYYQRIAYV